MEAQKRNHDITKKLRTINMNDLVFVKDFPNKKKWLSGKIVAIYRSTLISGKTVWREELSVTVMWMQSGLAILKWHQEWIPDRRYQQFSGDSSIVHSIETESENNDQQELDPLEQTQ